MSKTTLGKVSITVGGAWSSGTAYAKLTVVTNGGGAYLSKKAVPAGTALSNSTYWSHITEKGNTGNGISSVAKTGTSGNVDTYTITFTDGTTTAFTVTNGASTVTFDGVTQSTVNFDSNPQTQLNGLSTNKADKTAVSLKADKTSLAATDKRVGNIAEILKGAEYTLENGTSPVYTDTVQAGAQKYAELSMVGGKTVVWNQLVNATGTQTTSGVTRTYSNGRLILNGTASANNAFYLAIPSLKQGDKLFLSVPTNGSDSTYRVRLSVFNATFKTQGNVIYTVPQDAPSGISYIVDFFNGATFTDESFVPMLINLTAMGYSDITELTDERILAIKAYAAAHPEYDAGSLLSGKCDKVVTKDDDDATVREFTVPAEVQALEGYGRSAGSAYNYVDFGEKKFRKRVGSVDLGSLTWETEGVTTGIFKSNGLNPEGQSGGSIVQNIVCVPYIPDSTNNIYNGTTNKTIGVNGDNVWAYDSAYTDASDFKTAMNGVYLFYELATEVATDISAYLTDDNFIDTEVGGTVTFHQQSSTQLQLPNTVTYMVKVSEAI